MMSTDAPLRMTQHLVHLAIGEHTRCELTALPATATTTECPGRAVGARWEDGFVDLVCQRHADRAEVRGVRVVYAHRHDGSTEAP